jgi:chaperonin cofactor prefoldin
VAAIQEQQKQIEMLNSENQALKNQQLELNERLQKVEEMLAKMMKDEK